MMIIRLNFKIIIVFYLFIYYNEKKVDTIVGSGDNINMCTHVCACRCWSLGLYHILL